MVYFLGRSYCADIDDLLRLGAEHRRGYAGLESFQPIALVNDSRFRMPTSCMRSIGITAFQGPLSDVKYSHTLQQIGNT
jgi:hypothetical protein